MLLKQLYTRAYQLDHQSFVSKLAKIKKAGLWYFKIPAILSICTTAVSTVAVWGTYQKYGISPGVFFLSLITVVSAIYLISWLSMISKDKIIQFMSCWKRELDSDIDGREYLSNVNFNSNLTEWLNQAPAIVKNKFLTDTTFRGYINREWVTFYVIRENNTFYVLTDSTDPLVPADFILATKNHDNKFNSFEKQQVNAFIEGKESMLKPSESNISSEEIQQLAKEDNTAFSYSFVYAFIHVFEKLGIPFEQKYIEYAYRYLFRVEHYYANSDAFVELVLTTVENNPITLSDEKLHQVKSITSPKREIKETNIVTDGCQLATIKEQLIALKENTQHADTIKSVEHSLAMIDQLKHSKTDHVSQQYRQAKEIEFYLNEKISSIATYS